MDYQEKSPGIRHFRGASLFETPSLRINAGSSGFLRSLDLLNNPAGY
jgi:hypothetical protein